MSVFLAFIPYFNVRAVYRSMGMACLQAAILFVTISFYPNADHSCEKQAQKASITDF